jgi:hypothetical protein
MFFTNLLHDGGLPELLLFYTLSQPLGLALSACRFPIGQIYNIQAGRPHYLPVPFLSQFWERKGARSGG